ncbi:MAG TPA: Uma2 family endonuclease [Tepidisphaeraceae bacterium]|nr:Uma2 family endonuclease [Tepidisphaeraceae bacterium]
MTVQTTMPTLLTAENFASLGDIGPAELVRGRIVQLTKPKPRHGRVAMRIGTAIFVFVRDNKLGEVYAAETGFIAGRNPDSVRAPDVAFVRTEIAATHNEDEWLPHAPDLAVEVVSPSDRPEQVADKVQMWLSGGGRSVWVFDPKARTATVYSQDEVVRRFSASEELTDQSVLPGFKFLVGDAFEKVIT